MNALETEFLLGRALEASKASGGVTKPIENKPL